MSVHDQLYEKMSAEFERFKEELKTKPPDAIIDKAYEVTFKTEILTFFEVDDFLDEDDAQALLSHKDPLDKLYCGWLDTDSSYLDNIRDSVESTVGNLPPPPEHDASEISETVKATPSATTLYSDVKPGDWVIAAGNNEHRYLLGVVTAIDKLGTPEHGTENETDDVHVDFTAFDYPPDRIEEIEEHFSGLYGELKIFDEIPLDDVIMAPKMLIGISHLGHDEIERMGNLTHNCEAFCNCFMGGGIEPQSSRETELVERVEKNYADYQKSLLGFGKRELIDMAGKISAMSDAHSYMTCWHGYDEHELDYLLEFQNPLEVLADEWRERQTDLSDMSFAMEHIYQESDSLLEQYPVVHDSEAPADIGLRRFMGVDLVDFLGKISEKTIIHYPNDWNIDVDALRRYSMSEDFYERRFIWHVCSMGTHLKPERDVFIRDSGSHEYMTDYHQNDPDMFGYYVEITGRKGQEIIGNVFEVGNYADFASHLRLTALPLDSVTLTYSPDWGGVNSGKVLTVSRNEYDNDRHRLMSQSGRVTEITFHPKDERELNKILRDERVYRMSFPIGSQEAHLQRLTDKLAQIRKPALETTPTEKATQPPAARKKPSLTARLAEADAEAKAYNAQRAQNPVNINKNNKKEID